MAAATEPQQLSNAILSFALEGSFPEDITALPPVSGTDLNPTIIALDKAKAEIEVLRSNAGDATLAMHHVTTLTASRPKYIRSTKRQRTISARG